MGAVSSKDAFGAIVNKLLTTDIEPTDHAFWDALWKTNLTVEDIFDIISPSDVRKLVNEKPLNLKILFTQAVAQLYQVVETPFPVYFDQALNCARILSRILPIMLECSYKFIMDMFWSKQNISFNDDPIDIRSDAGNIAEGEIRTPASPTSKKEGPNGETEPLAVILINALFHLLFLPEFTIDDPHKEFTEKDFNSNEFRLALMWSSGVGSAEKTVVSSTQYDSNRIEILRLMISAFSDALYQHPDRFDNCASYWLEVGTSADVPYAEIVFYSLMNTVLGYDPVGWGLPYGSLVAQDTAKPLMETSAQALLILLDYGHPIKLPHINPDGSINAVDPAAQSSVPYVDINDVDAKGFNIFRKIMATIEAPDQLNFIFRGFSRLLNNVLDSEATYLPNSITRITIEQELLVLLWKCLEEIPRFLPYMLKHCNVCELIAPITCFLVEGRRDPAKVGMMYLCTFILLKFSGERNFGVQLNKPFEGTLPGDIPHFTGTFADLLVVVLHKMIVTGADKLSALFNCFLTIICNISPYTKSLSTVTAVKLVNLFQLFTSPRFLYSAEQNHLYVSLLLETFNNIIQYQYEGNVNLVYAIIRRKEVFDSLFGLSLKDAIQGVKDLGNGIIHNELPSLKPSQQPKKKGDGKKRKDDEVTSGSQMSVPSNPTELISTASMERKVNADGEFEDSIMDGTGSLGQSSPPTRAAMASGGAAPPSYQDVMRAKQESESQALAAETAKEISDIQNAAFIPNECWLAAVKAELPLATISRLLKHLAPQVEELSANTASVDELQVIEFIRRTTMVGLLPVPHPIVIRKYQPNKFTSIWFTAFQWGVIFMHNQAIPLFEGHTINLFSVQSTKPSRN